MNSKFYYKNYLIEIKNKNEQDFDINITIPDYGSEDIIIVFENCFDRDILKKYKNLFITNSLILDLEHNIKKEIDKIQNKLEKNKIFF